MDSCPWCGQCPCAKTCGAGALTTIEIVGVTLISVAALAGIVLLVLWRVR